MNAKIKRGLVLLAVGVFVALAIRSEASASDPTTATQALNIGAAAAFWVGLVLVGWGLVDLRRSRRQASDPRAMPR